MTGCAEADMRVWLSASANPKRKYRYTWELAETTSGARLCVNTQRANTVVGEALQASLFEAIGPLTELRAEQRYGYDNRRIDWQGMDSAGQRIFVEVKSVTLAEQQQGYFPDTVSKRASEHLHSLIAMRREGHRAAVVYCVLHSDVNRVQAAAHCDPGYAALAAEAKQQGVEFYALQTDITPQGIYAVGELPNK